jgi:hypothetical protein
MVNSHVWYVGYGSNLCEERFLCYISGKQFKLGGTLSTGCRDKSLPLANKPFLIDHSLYFAYNARGWENGGVAFISLERGETNEKTYGRMWKITVDQFSDIWNMEGKSLYNEKMDLGRDKENIPVYTITSKTNLKPNLPSNKYLKTMVIGLKETYKLADEEIVDYIISRLDTNSGVDRERLHDIVNLHI